jgi:hypothetical protein
VPVQATCENQFHPGILSRFGPFQTCDRRGGSRRGDHRRDGNCGASIGIRDKLATKYVSTSSKNPQSDRWRDHDWSPWRTLDEAAGAETPNVQGIYRIRCAGHVGLAYIGISLNLRSRLGGLRRGVTNPPDYLGHSAAGCLAEIQRRHHAPIEVSFVTMEGTKPRELKGREVDLIAAHRDAVKTSPPCQFVGHGGKLDLDD